MRAPAQKSVSRETHGLCPKLCPSLIQMEKLRLISSFARAREDHTLSFYSANWGGPGLHFIAALFVEEW